MLRPAGSIPRRRPRVRTDIYLFVSVLDDTMVWGHQGVQGGLPPVSWRYPSGEAYEDEPWCQPAVVYAGCGQDPSSQYR